MTEITAKTPWAGHTGDVPLHLDYFDGSMFEALELVAKKYPRNIAFDFMGKATTYPQMIEEIKKCARSLKTIGVRAGDKVTIAMPNCPQAIYMFYAVNLVGGIANMIHPLSAEKEIEFYLNESESVTAITLDQFYNKFESIRQNTKVVNIIIASVKDELSKPVRAGYMLTEGRKIAKIPKDAPVIRWKEFMNMGKACFWNYSVKRTGDDPAVILYSGGTTGTTKGIVLTNRNFNALGQQVIAANPMFNPGDKMLAAMPLFHGFGLGVCVHTMLSQGGRCILVPRFTAKSYAKLITKYHCNFIAGVPTLYEALLRLPSMENADLSSLKGVFSGGDSLSIELKKKLDKFLYAHGAPVQVREGYGTTETVTACCLTPPHMFKEGSIGVPFPDTYIKIVEPGTDQEVPYGTEGEILLAGPTVMKEYMKHPDETAQTLRRHADGLTWVYTGDLGTMDSEGFVYFRGRAKRMIVSSGYNVYPGQIENILDANEMVQMSCVIGIPDAYRMQKVKAFVKLAAGIPANDATRQALMSYCSKHIAKYAMPCDIEFRDELPKTLVGKVAYRVLEEEEQAKHAAEAPAAPAEEERSKEKSEPLTERPAFFLVWSDPAARRSEVVLPGVAVEAEQMAGQIAPRLAKRIVVVRDGLPVDALAAREDLGELGIVAHAGGLTAAGGELRGGAFHHAAPTAQDAPHFPEPEDEKGGGAHGGDQPGDPRRHRLQLLFLQILSLEPSIAIFSKNWETRV